jgi:hypothetical protein
MKHKKTTYHVHPLETTSVEGLYLLSCAAKLLRGKALQSGELEQLKNSPLEHFEEELQKEYQLTVEERSFAHKIRSRAIKMANHLPKEATYYNDDGSLKEEALQEIAAEAAKAIREREEMARPLVNPETFLSKMAPGLLLLYITQDDPQKNGETEQEYRLRLNSNQMIRNAVANKTGVRPKRPLGGIYSKEVIEKGKKEVKDVFDHLSKNMKISESQARRLLTFCDSEQVKKHK